MPHYEIFPESVAGTNVTIVRFSGQADTATIRDLIATLAALGEGARILMDESELRPGLILPQDLRGIVEQWRALIARKTIRIAVFASNPLVYGMNRMVESIAADDAKDHLAVFRARPDALAWLLRP
ncbi:MAG TPA: hypothetical protein VEU77_06360 [Candidatus Acidoferrales bacterium]|nr:hypothetical protein [Candidatus Acidoferrales bacterium]